MLILIVKIKMNPGEVMKFSVTKFFCLHGINFFAQVNVVVDYIKPAQDNFPEKTCCTVTRENV